jgi:hypothetical protein
LIEHEPQRTRDEEDGCGAPVVGEDDERVGFYASVTDDLRAMLEPEVAPEVTWILDLLDYEGVLARFEVDGSRHFARDGAVFRRRPE